MSGPISPKNIETAKAAAIPEGVFEAFNELIAKEWDGHQAILLQKDVARLAAKKAKCTVAALYDNHWLDIEDAYRRAGWNVEYDKPAYCESYEASFTFSKKRAR